MAKILINCQICQKEFGIPAHRIPTAKYCSRKCQAIGAISKYKTNCKICHNEFEYIAVREGTAKYCSRECYYKAMQLKGKTEYKCAHCGKIFRDSKSCKRKYCSKSCVNKGQKELWKPVFTTVRSAMKTRGLINKCEKCGYNEVKEILGIHHKDCNNKNNAMTNLIVLCPNCHSLEHKKHIVH